MTKHRFLFFACLYCMGPGAFGQQQKYAFGHSIEFNIISTDKKFMVRQDEVFKASDTDVDGVTDYLKADSSGYQISFAREPRSPVILGVKLNPALTDYSAGEVPSMSKSYTSHVISDSSEAIVIALGITPDNVQDYRYHVVENDDKEIVAWSRIPQMEKLYGAKRPFAFLGRYRAPGKKLMIEVVNSKNYGIRDGVIFDWRVNFKPIVTQMSVVVGEYYFKVTDTGRNRRYATRFDPVTRLPLDLKLPADSYSAILLEFKSHETIPYSVYLAKDIDGKKDTVPLDRFWPDNHFLCENWQYNKPGKYVLIIQRAQELNYWNEAQILRLPFEVVPPPLLEKKVSLRNIILYSIATLLGVAFLFFAYWRNSKRKIVRETRARQTAYRQLRAVRSQLNPHFIFNSLSSIQSLMNKNDVRNANHYLVKFASLTRKVLDHSEQELISLEEEIKSLDDYLQMEQLRFRFRYTIRVDEAINQANTEIPVLLLQPFVENAIKHAVAGLQEKGIIEIGIEQKGNALILWVRDNGTGFASDIAGSGNGTRANIPAGEQGKSSFGIKLSRERITLLNQIYKEKTALLDIDPADTGTKVTIQLNNWL